MDYSTNMRCACFFSFISTLPQNMRNCNAIEPISNYRMQVKCRHYDLLRHRVKQMTHVANAPAVETYWRNISSRDDIRLTLFEGRLRGCTGSLECTVGSVEQSGGLEQCRQSSTYSFYSVMVKHQWSLHQVKSGPASQLLILPRTRVWNFPTMILVRCCPRSTDKNAPTSSSFPSSFYYNPPHSPRPQMLRPPCLP